MVRVASSTRVGPTFFIAGWCAGANMKPIPASRMQRPTSSGDRSIFTPSDDSTSAAPEREERARLPCLATVTPAPATMNEAQVETLTDPDPSPPVPTISTASAGAVTRSILPRIADTAPVISSTVSPRTRSAINKPPICEGVASPDITAAKAEAASSRDRDAPVATFAMIGFRLSIAPRSVVVIVVADSLREGAFVDRSPDIGLELRDIFGNLLVFHASLQRVLQLLDVVGCEIGRRHGDIGDAEHDPLTDATSGLPGPVLGRAERGGNDRGRQAGRGVFALEVSGRFDRHAEGGRLIGQLAARFELLHDLGALGLQPIVDLVLVPFRFDLVLDLVQ